MVLFRNSKFEIAPVLDDEGLPLTYWYNVRDLVSGRCVEVDIRELPAYLAYFSGKKPEHMHFYFNKKKFVPEIILLAVRRHEIDL